LQAVSLSAATGSGKTVIATAAIETILEGDDAYAPQPEATFLWVTDQPELNEQTRRKMLDASSVLMEDHLVVLGATFDEEFLKPGRVHFLNIQKLGKEKSLVTRGDGRTYTIWDTIANTVKTRPKAFFLIIDEAHRGMGESASAKKDAATIIQKFIKGSPDEIPPVPIVFGISATPERFFKLIEGTGRTLRPLVVNPEDVRASGLLKEVITLYYPEEEQPSDMTMLRDAARSLQKVGREWTDYCTAQGDTVVRPILVVQVQDGDGKKLISKTDLAEAIKCIRDELGEMPNDAFAHAFQEGTRIDVDGRELRYIAPSDIQGDTDVRVVFFKSSLNTGWDCPRAEVMMSFRRAQDATLIAQLVGRMVRTPLARRVDANERLNAVPLYLPHYDADGLKAVIEHLTKPDAEAMPPTEVEKGQNIVTLDRAEGTNEIVTALSALPSYTIPKARKSSEVRRLMKLARLLANDELDDAAHDKAVDLVLGTLRSEYKRLKGTKQFKAVVEEKGKLEVRAVNWQIGSGDVDPGKVIQIDIAVENVDDLFEHAGRKLSEGLHKAWWRSRVEDDPSATDKAKLELFALCIDAAVMKAVEKNAQQLVQRWLKVRRLSRSSPRETSRATTRCGGSRWTRNSRRSTTRSPSRGGSRRRRGRSTCTSGRGSSIPRR
jgi:type III restriction enzyme